MPSDYLLIIDGVPGESKDSKHPNAIDIDSWSWSATNSGSFGTGSGGGAGKAAFVDVHFSAKVSKASPLLFKHCASGQHIRKAQLIVRKQGDTQQDYYIVDFEDLLVSSYQTNGDAFGGSMPIDMFTLNFGKVKYQYSVQRQDGGLDPAITTGWSLKENKKQ